MATSDRILRAAVAVAGLLLIGGCTATPQPPDDASTSSSRPASTPASTTTMPSSDEPTSASPTDSAPSVVPPPTTTPLTPVDGTCDVVTNPTTNTSEPVVVLEGSVNCAEALAVAREYLATIQRGEAEGQGLFATIRGWDCVWPYVPGRSHAESYLKCTDPTGENSIRIGD